MTRSNGSGTRLTVQKKMDLTYAHIATIVAALSGCTKADAPAVRSDQSPTQAAAAASSAPPAEKNENEQAQPVVPGMAATATPIGADSAKKKGEARPMAHPTSGQASCGAGTCTADPKKK
jgi:hypothetical protein